MSNTKQNHPSIETEEAQVAFAAMKAMVATAREQGLNSDAAIICLEALCHVRLEAARIECGVGHDGPRRAAKELMVLDYQSFRASRRDGGKN